MIRLFPSVWCGIGLALTVVGCPEPQQPTDPSDSTDATDHTDVPDPTDLPIIAEAEDLDPDPDHLQVRLEAAPHTFTIGGQDVEGYAYNGQVPGPTLRAKLGDRITAEIVNRLDVPTTVHWHGVHVPYAMDGVTWSSAPIAPGETFIATFTLDQVGTFWYHPHFDTARQVDLGLYGALIVEDPAEPAADQDIVVIADSWAEHSARPDEGDHHGLDGTALTWTLNGAVFPTFRPESGTHTRLRFINASNAGYLALQGGEDWSWIAGDQGLRGLAHTDRELLGPGDRADVSMAAAPGATSLVFEPYSLNGGEVSSNEPVGELAVQPTGAASIAPFDWGLQVEAPSEDPGYTDVRYVLQGDSASKRWTINGETFPDVTVRSVPLDSDVIMEVRNVSATEHPFHLHGHEFEVLSINGVPPPTRTIEDTFNVPIRSVLRLQLRADNEGSWMAHCHILPHAKGGMMTVLDVVPR
ncbi:MAG: multicopper oxidase family protein [Myxococcota bacterium]